MAPNDSWTSFGDMDRESDHSKSIEQVVLTANFSSLCTRALEIRASIDRKSRGLRKRKSRDGGLTCSIDSTRFANGYFNVVFAINFSDSTHWIARIRLPNSSSSDSEVEASMLSEIATMRLVRSRTTIPVPLVYGFDVDVTNLLGFRYILMEALPGHSSGRGFAETVPEAKWDKFTDQFADYYYQLSTLRFPSMGSLTSGLEVDQEPQIFPCSGEVLSTTSIEYFYSERKQSTKSIKADHGEDENWGTAAWILEQAVPSMIVEEYLHGPFPLCHMDLHYNNILVDDEFNITGIVDWTGAQTVPVERFIVCPEFVTFPGLTDEQNAPIVAFGEMFASAFRRRELEASGASEVPLIADLIGTALWEIVYRCTYSEYWKAPTDAQMVMRQIYGNDAKWEDFVSLYKNAQAPATRKARKGPKIQFKIFK